MAEQSHVSDSDGEEQPAKLPRLGELSLGMLTDQAFSGESALSEALRRVVGDAKTDPVNYAAFGNAP